MLTQLQRVVGTAECWYVCLSMLINMQRIHIVLSPNIVTAVSQPKPNGVFYASYATFCNKLG